MNPGPIGIFDSGLGGLTVAHAIHQALPHEATLYFGDTARVPYGPKSPEVVRRYSIEIGEWLVGQGVKAIVIACNTSTAHALDLLVATLPVPVVGVVDPGARAAVQSARGGPIGVIGTAGTVGSGAYLRAIHGLAPDAVVIQQACPLFVPLVEEGWFAHRATRMVAEEYLAPLIRAGVRSVVLGCTHYPLLIPLLSDVLGADVTLVDSAEETAATLSDLLHRRGLVAPPRAVGTVEHRFAVSDDPERFRTVGSRFLGERLGAAEVARVGA